MTKIDRTFPHDRVQQFLCHHRYMGINPDVKGEGLFLLIGKDGKPQRQVFLGITAREFIIVKQVIWCIHTCSLKFVLFCFLQIYVLQCNDDICVNVSVS